MMEAQDITYYQEQLIEYLRSTKYLRNADDAKIQRQVSAIEVDLQEVIKSNLHIDLQVIYEYLDKDALRELVNETNRGRSLGAQNEQSEGLLRDAINYYLGYLGSKKHPLSEKEKINRKKTPPTEPTSTGTTDTPIDTTGFSNDNSGKSNTTKPEVSEPKEYDKLEGAKHEETVTRYERDRGNRKDCIAHYGYVCQVCQMDFEKTYGELGKEFIEVHHLYPVHQGERKVNPIEDLIPLCSNCHSMIHRMSDVSDWRGLRELYQSKKSIDSNNAEESK